MFRGQKVIFGMLTFMALVGLVSAIEPAGTWGFGPCAHTYNSTGDPNDGMRYNQCYSTSPDVQTQGRYCDAKGNYIYNCSDSCPCLSDYFCSPTGTCDSCENGEACGISSESGLVNSAADFLTFIPSMFPLLTAFAIAILAFWLLELVKHLDEY